MRLLSAAVTSTVKGYSVLYEIWNKFFHAVTDVRIEITMVQIRGHGNVYYFVLVVLCLRVLWSRNESWAVAADATL